MLGNCRSRLRVNLRAFLHEFFRLRFHALRKNFLGGVFADVFGDFHKARVRASCYFGHDESRHAHGREVMEEMLHPRVVHGRKEDSTPHPSPLPDRGGEGEVAHVLPQVFAAPIAHVERRIGQEVIIAKAGMEVAAEVDERVLTFLRF